MSCIILNQSSMHYPGTVVVTQVDGKYYATRVVFHFKNTKKKIKNFHTLRDNTITALVSFPSDLLTWPSSCHKFTDTKKGNNMSSSAQKRNNTASSSLSNL